MTYRLLAAAASTALLATLSITPTITPITPGASAQTEGANCSMPESNAEALVIFTYPFWDHSDLTVAVQAHPSTSAERLTAIGDAIEIWDAVLRDCLGGAVTLTNLGSSPAAWEAADVVIKHVPRVGAMSFSGIAICVRVPGGACNVLVSSEAPPNAGLPPDTPRATTLLTLHELGHVLGLGHTTNLMESTDLMGYGWFWRSEPVLSDCDIDALASIWSWAIGGEPAPHQVGPPWGETTYDCKQ